MDGNIVGNIMFTGITISNKNFNVFNRFLLIALGGSKILLVSPESDVTNICTEIKLSLAKPYEYQNLKESTHLLLI